MFGAYSPPIISHSVRWKVDERIQCSLAFSQLDGDDARISSILLTENTISLLILMRSFFTSSWLEMAAFYRGCFIIFYPVGEEIVYRSCSRVGLSL